MCFPSVIVWILPTLKTHSNKKKINERVYDEETQSDVIKKQNFFMLLKKRCRALPTLLTKRVKFIRDFPLIFKRAWNRKSSNHCLYSWETNKLDVRTC